MLNHFAVRVSLLAALVLLTGCRTYGSYDSTNLTLTEIEAANQLFEGELSRAQAELATLQQAASQNPMLADVAEAYAGAVALHEDMLAQHQAYAEEASEHRRNYRVQHRTFGAISAEQMIVKERYYRALSSGAHAVSLVDAGRYQVSPPYYVRAALQARAMTADELIRQTEAAATAAPAEGEETNSQTP